MASVPLHPTAARQFEGYWSSMLSLPIESAVKGRVSIHSNTSSESYRLDLSFGQRRRLSVWQLWREGLGETLATTLDDGLGGPLRCSLLVEPLAPRPARPEICTHSTFTYMHPVRHTTHAGEAAEVWSLRFPAGPEGSHMPAGSVLNVTIRRLGSRGPGEPDEALPLWHSLASPDGRWVIEHFAASAERAVDWDEYRLPKECTSAQPKGADALVDLHASKASKASKAHGHHGGKHQNHAAVVDKDDWPPAHWSPFRSSRHGLVRVGEERIMCPFAKVVPALSDDPVRARRQTAAIPDSEGRR